MASKVVAFLALCYLLLAAKQVAAGRGRILNDNLADAEINKTTRKLIQDEALYNDLLNNPTKYATQQNDTAPKIHIILKEDVLYNEILKNPAKFNAILNDTALNNDPAAKIIKLNETAMFNEILNNPIKYTEIMNGPAQNNNTAKYNTVMGWGWESFNELIFSNFSNDTVIMSSKDPAKNNNLMYSTVLNGTDPNNLKDTGKYNTLMGFWGDLYQDWKDATFDDNVNYTIVWNSTAKYNTLLSAQDAKSKAVSSSVFGANDTTKYNTVV